MSQWRPVSISLPYKIGPMKLFSCRFNAVMPVDYFAAWPEYPECEQKIIDATEKHPLAVCRSQPLSTIPPRLRFANGRIWYVPATYRHQIVNITGTFSTYLERLTGKTRSSIQRKVKKFRNHFGDGAVFETFRSVTELDRFYDRARKLSSLTYQERVLGAGLPATELFVKNMTELAQADSVRAYLLTVDGRDIAYLYSPGHDGVLFYNFLGYDPDFAEWSPGTVLQYLAFESIFNEGRFRCFDFEEGEGQHKSTFATDAVLCGDLFVFRLAPWPSAVVVAHWGFLAAVRSASAALRNLGLHQRFKRLLRAQ
jgi:hypothetical protein